MLLGAALAGAALFFLARAAIDFGQLGSDGELMAWLVALVAALGALVCLVLVLALVARVLFTLGIIREYKPRRLGARRRAR
jgi:hypothetical protein